MFGYIFDRAIIFHWFLQYQTPAPFQAPPFYIAFGYILEHDIVKLSSRLKFPHTSAQGRPQLSSERRFRLQLPSNPERGASSVSFEMVLSPIIFEILFSWVHAYTGDLIDECRVGGWE